MTPHSYGRLGASPTSPTISASESVSCAVIADDGLPDEDLPGDHAWHYKYNRRLSFFSHSVERSLFTPDGQWLVAATPAGTVKIFDTGIWAEAFKLKDCLSETPLALSISPSQRWLVCVYPTFMNVFQCSPQWNLQQRIEPPVDPVTKKPSEWCCVAFAPLSEVDNPGGRAGEDNHLAAFASRALCVLDYSGGWVDTPKRMCRSFDEERPVSIAYTACGWWIVCGYESGQLQIWNHFSLTLDRTLRGHDGQMSCISSSPRCASYDTRMVTSGMDCTLRVWNQHGWVLEQIAPDTKADRNGIRSCMFSSSGDWLVSVAVEICIWRVVISRRRKFQLCLHQRLSSQEGLSTACYCKHRDALAVGSRDGVLAIWSKMEGWPKEPLHANDDEKASRPEGASPSPPTTMLQTPARPMFGVSPEGLQGNTTMRGFRATQNTDWMMQTNLRSLLQTTHCALGERLAKCSASTPAQRPVPLPAMRSATSASSRLPSASVQKVSAFGAEDRSAQKSSSVPELSRWKSTAFDGNGNAGWMPPVAEGKGRRGSLDGQPGASSILRSTGTKVFGSALTAQYHPDGPGTRLNGELPKLVKDEADMTPARAAMSHATRALVQRISLDPHKIC